MTSLWIRVAADIADSIKVRRFAQSCGVSAEAAVGLLVFVWGKVADKRETGEISDIPDNLLEEWARWRGDAGLFAKCFRETFASDGKIHDWHEYQGKLIEHRRKERERWHRRSSAGGSPRAMPEPAGANGNGHGNTSLLPPLQPVASERRESVFSRLMVASHQAAVDHLLRCSRNPDAFLSEVEAVLDGQRNLSPQHPTPEQVGTALWDMHVNGKPPEVAVFHAYCVRAARPPARAHEVRRGTKPNAGEETYERAIRALQGDAL
jgi:hypothetical protein